MTDWKIFRENLLNWYRPERRPMPWKEEGDPYKVWLSEIILQQTRVEQGLPYFNDFVAVYPTVTDLAAAPDDDVMKMWEGLGYYSRARNLLKAARMVANELNGQFPDTYAGLLKLPGVGPYTAAAIASFAFGRSVAVLDGNVFRVLSRYAADATPIDTGPGKKHFITQVELALGVADAARFNQAIMDFGALVCTPKRADCKTCPLNKSCKARAEDSVYDLPVKSKKLTRRSRFFHYLVITDHEGNYLIERRKAGDIWEALYQFPLVEADGAALPTRDLPQLPAWPGSISAADLNFERRSKVFQHQLTHQSIGVVFHVFSSGKSLDTEGVYLKVAAGELTNYAFPRVITRFLEDRTLTLNL